MSRPIAIALAILLTPAACGGTKTPAPQPATPAPAPAAATPAPAATPPASTSTSTPTPAAAAPAAPDAPTPLAVGDAAPDVTLALQDGKQVALSSLKGGRVLVYFYPKDETPGCTAEAEAMRDRYPDLQAAGITVFGVSVQDAASHKAFIDNHELPFPLVADTDGKVAAAFHVPLRANGLATRQSFLVGKDGRIEAEWLKVDPSTHATDVLAALAK